MKAIILVLCAALAAYLLVFRQSTEVVPVAAVTATSSPSTTVPPPPADSQTFASLPEQTATFSQAAATLSPLQRRQTAERLINELKAAVSSGGDLETAYAKAEQLTPYIESDPKLLEALNYKIWRDMKRDYIPPAPPTAAQQQQLEAYRLASDKTIDEVLKTVEGDDARRAAIEEKLSALRLEIFGESAQQPVSR